MNGCASAIFVREMAMKTAREPIKGMTLIVRKIRGGQNNGLVVATTLGPVEPVRSDRFVAIPFLLEQPSGLPFPALFVR